jgi:ATP-dependent HslUV protease ATP-binding subunit HslU
MQKNIESLTPIQIVNKLNKYIVGQSNAKRSVALALRNKWRKQQITTAIKNEIIPKNIILIGGTGTGKTEIARRLAKITNSPFVKVEATKFTEVGYVGRDVESMIRDLLFVAIKMCTDRAIEEVSEEASIASENYILDILISKYSKINSGNEKIYQFSRNKLKQILKSGNLDNHMISIEVTRRKTPLSSSNNNLDDVTQNFQDIIQNTFQYLNKATRKSLTIKEALKIIKHEESYKLIDLDNINTVALKYAEDNGIIFIDEIDKIIGKQARGDAGISREGVQRDILPIVEGSIVQTRYGAINTHNILFISAGSFYTSSTADLIPELQGRFPIKVFLNNLCEEDFMRILVEPRNSLVKQYQALLIKDNLNVIFKDSGITELAKVAAYVNSEVENIGARRLYAVMENLLEEESFNAPHDQDTIKDIIIDNVYVSQKLSHLIQNDVIHRDIL